MPTFDGLGLTPQQLTAAMWVFGIATALLYAWSRWKGSREADKQPAAREYSITGQFSDMQPVKELAEIAKALLAQVSRIASALEEETERRQRQREADDAAARRDRERDVDEAVDRRNRGRKPPAST
jgi:hypothetical protein